MKKGVNGRHLTADTELAFSGVSYIKVGTGNVEVGCRCPNAGAKTISAALAASEQDPKGFIEDLQVFELVYVPRILADEATKTFEVYTVALVPAWVFQEELFDKGKPQPSAYGLPKKKATLAGERDRLEDLFTRRGASESVRDYFERQPLDGKGRYTDLQVSYFRHPFTLSRKLGNAGTTFFDDCSNFWRTVKERIESQRTVLLPDALRGTTLTSAQETAAPTGRMNRNAPRRR